MKRRNYKVKHEDGETSRFRDENHDLAYYIHDRVELMHQVFSVLKTKELMAMVPYCIRNISIDDLQELCLEEVLGISSKRLCAILDGAEPPSDTESSSASGDKMETISLDSISSDDEVLSHHSKKSKKHRHKSSKNKSKRKHKKSKDNGTADDNEGPSGVPGRAGLTALELLELTARARAIRAQLQNENNKRAQQEAETTAGCSRHSSDNEVEIKEEQPEVVEISSEDEKPKIEDLNKAMSSESTSKVNDEISTSVTKKINNLVVTVPQKKATSKVKLKRTKPTPVVNANSVTSKNIIDENKEKNNHNSVETNESIVTVATNKKQQSDKPVKDKTKKKQKKKEKKRAQAEGDASDHDEITLQLSDSEKMDLLEDLGRKDFRRVPPSSSEDSESSSSSDSDASQTTSEDDEGNMTCEKISNHIQNESNTEKSTTVEQTSIVLNLIDNVTSIQHQEIENRTDTISENESSNKICKSNLNNEKSDSNPTDGEIAEKTVEIPVQSSLTAIVENVSNDRQETAESTNLAKVEDNENILKNNEDIRISIDENASECRVGLQKSSIFTNTLTLNDAISKQKELSEGELSESGNSEVEITDSKPEIVCISDEDIKVHTKKKKKKEKKSKKAKKPNDPTVDIEVKHRTNLGNSNSEVEVQPVNIPKDLSENNSIILDTKSVQVSEESDDVYEILSLSDDSSCCEIEGVSVLSKEPTAEEIQALSEQIDEIERRDVVTDEEIRKYEEANKDLNDETNENPDNISWRDRYLGSKKVKLVLNVSNILNALRKKNKELKKQIEESKTKEKETFSESDKKENVEPAKENIEEGTIEQYETLESLTKYVDPVSDPDSKEEKNTSDNKDAHEIQDNAVTKEMKQDAKLLLKMYKKLLKYNDMNKPKDPNKKKKKKRKKSKKENVTNNDTNVS